MTLSVTAQLHGDRQRIAARDEVIHEHAVQCTPTASARARQRRSVGRARRAMRRRLPDSAGDQADVLIDEPSRRVRPSVPAPTGGDSAAMFA
jgi:hypothetical protein